MASHPAPRVIVAGLGAMGAATAWQLARRGAQVIGFDTFAPPHDRGSSHGGSRIIREMAFEGARYVPLVRRAFGLWADLEQRAGITLLLPTGAIYVGRPDAALVVGSLDSARAHEVDSETLDAEAVRRRFPALAPAAGMIGVVERRAGVLRPEEAIAAMLGQARGLGAHLHVDDPVVSWEADGGGVTVQTTSGRHRADALVLALGGWMPAELEGLGVRLEVERVVQHWFVPVDARLMAPGRCPVYLFEDADGLVFYGFPQVDGLVKCAVHHRGTIVTADTLPREIRTREIELVHAMAARWVPAAAGDHVRSAVCTYTNTPDGHFLVDRHPSHERVVLVSACNGIGFKFAPAIGEGVALLVLEGAPPADMVPFGLGRALPGASAG